jgi:hypothetical protein
MFCTIHYDIILIYRVPPILLFKPNELFDPARCKNGRRITSIAVIIHDIINWITKDRFNVALSISKPPASF